MEGRHAALTQSSKGRRPWTFFFQNVKESFERVATDWEEDLHKRGELLRRERVGLLHEYCLLAEKRAKVDEEIQGQQDQFAEEKRRMIAQHVSPNEIIGINMGGEKLVEVKRSLLTHIEGTFIASMFS